MSAKIQLNVRVKPAIRDSVVRICEDLDWTRDDLAEVAYAMATNSGTITFTIPQYLMVFCCDKIIENNVLT